MNRLQRMSREELERVYLEEYPLTTPEGLFDGQLLCWLDSPPVRHPVWRPLSAAMFQLTPFGVDFTRRVWFFGAPQLRVGRFVPLPGPSRFRPTRALGMHYQGSSLPSRVKHKLYDELKPVDERTCLGVGGLVLDDQSHAVFFFSLVRRA